MIHSSPIHLRTLRMFWASHAGTWSEGRSLRNRRFRFRLLLLQVLLLLLLRLPWARWVDRAFLLLVFFLFCCILGGSTAALQWCRGFIVVISAEAMSCKTSKVANSDRGVSFRKWGWDVLEQCHSKRNGADLSNLVCTILRQITCSRSREAQRLLWAALLKQIGGFICSETKHTKGPLGL